VPADLEKLAYDSALRALDKQERLVEELRARAGAILAASSLAVTFLGGQSLDGTGPVGLAMLALLSFVVCVGATVFVLLPKEGLTFSVSGAGVSRETSRLGDDAGAIYRRLAGTLDRFWDENDEAVRRLRLALSIAASVLGVEVVALAALLGGTIV
jgi:hypothetical protein